MAKPRRPSTVADVLSLRGAAAVMSSAVLAGCGGGDDRPAVPTRHHPAPRPPTAPYEPSARHAQRPAHSVFADEIGENITGTPFARIVALFGAPLDDRRTTTGHCVYYRLVGDHDRGWAFCFTGGLLISARGLVTQRDFRAGTRESG